MVSVVGWPPHPITNVYFAVFGKLWNDILEQNNLQAQDVPK